MENETIPQEQVMHLPKYLIAMFIVSIVLSLIAIGLSIASIVYSLEEPLMEEDVQVTIDEDVADQDLAEDTDETESQTNQGIMTYSNEELGISFDYPAGYRISESEELEGFDQGELLTISVFSETNDLIFQAKATSSDYALGVGEGCCYYFSGTLDMDKSSNELGDIIEDQLQEIFVKYKADVGNFDGMGFYYATSYATTNIVAANIVPVNHAIYSNVFFTSGVLWSQDGSYNENIENIREVFDLNDLQMGDQLYPELDDGLTQEYFDIVNSITWE